MTHLTQWWIRGFCEFLWRGMRWRNYFGIASSTAGRRFDSTRRLQKIPRRFNLVAVCDTGVLIFRHGTPRPLTQ